MRTLGILILGWMLAACGPLTAADDAEDAPASAPLPAGAAKHTGALDVPPTRVLISPDGTRIVTNGTDNLIRIWDAATLAPAKPLKTEKGPYADICYSLDGKSVLTAGTDKIVRKWDLESGKEALAFDAHDTELRAIAASPDGRRIASSDSGGVIRIWDVNDGRKLAELTGGHPAVRIDALSFGPDGKLLLSEAMDESAHLWDPIVGESLRRLPEHDNTMAAIALSPDGAHGVSTRMGGLFRYWEAATGRMLRIVHAHNENVSCVAFTPDGRYLLTGSGDKTLRQWELSSGVEIRRFTLASGPMAVAAGPDGRWAATVSPSEGLVRWDLTAMPLGPDDGNLDFDRAWSKLGSKNYDERTAALRFYAGGKDPGAAVKDLSGRIAGFGSADATGAGDLIRRLDDSSYTVRWRAFEDLQALGGVAREALASAQSHPSPEVRSRVKALMKDLSQEDPRMPLAAEILVLLNRPEAWAALETFAAKQGSAFAPYARAALQRRSPK